MSKYVFVAAPNAFKSRRGNRKGGFGFAKGSLRSLRRTGGNLSDDANTEVELNIPPSKKTDEDWEFDRTDLEALTEIGSGQFGKVYVGTALNIIKGQPKTKVAVKELATEDSSALSDFLAETKIMKSIDNPNVVRLLGVCSKGEPRYMIMELMSKGDLKEVLTAGRPVKSVPSTFSQQQLVRMGADVARGMQYLGELRIVHRDLAARNCLVGDDFVVKIGDFGLTRQTYSREYYRMTGTAPLPIRWMAVESLSDGVFSTQSDVWSFGIVLWEIFTFGGFPYPAHDNQQVAEMVVEDDYRLPQPLCCPSDVFELMEQCWEEDGDERIGFTLACSRLQDFEKASQTLKLTLEEVCDDSLMAQWSETLTEDVQYDGIDADPNDAYTNAYDNAHHANYDNLDANINDAPSSSMSGYEIPIQKKPDVSISPTKPTQDQQLADVCTWVSSMTARDVTPATFHANLKSGETLCMLMNNIENKVAIRKINAPKSALKMMENISKFITAALTYGLKAEDMFDVEDLWDDLDMKRVLQSLISLKQLVDARAAD